MNKKIILMAIFVVIMGAIFTGCSTQQEPEKIRYTYIDENGEKVTETFYAVPKNITFLDRVIPFIQICVFLVLLRRVDFYPMHHLCYKLGIDEPNLYWEYYSFYDLEVKGICAYVPLFFFIPAAFCMVTEPISFLFYPILIIFCITTFTIDTIFYWRLGKRFQKSRSYRIKMILMPSLYLRRLARDETSIY